MIIAVGYWLFVRIANILKNVRHLLICNVSYSRIRTSYGVYSYKRPTFLTLQTFDIFLERFIIETILHVSALRKDMKHF
jgi:hypothetical protein